MSDKDKSESDLEKSFAAMPPEAQAEYLRIFGTEEEQAEYQRRRFEEEPGIGVLPDGTLNLVKPKKKKMRATGHQMQLTRQVGEHLVAAELGRMGYVATPFAGNVPMYDLLVADVRGYAIPVQVKAINKKGSWQFSADTFLHITNVKDDYQKKEGRKVLINPNLICIFVLLKGRGEDEFYVFPLHELQDYCDNVYKPRGPGSKNPDSFHCAISPHDLSKFKDNWRLVEQAFESAA